ncbi:MAG: TonB-dependent receptor plug domain-containing protein [Muribaculaceae bacterium]|nr:TonB-dependent receptor plug domain-containing protein [Muribaculaceae bacterium]
MRRTFSDIKSNRCGVSFLLTVIIALFINNTSFGQTEVLKNIDVWGTRPLRDTGVQRTVFDSLALKQNVALSMADILAFNSSVFVKNYGRATLSTVSFRGTSPSHTQVTWNGMRINNPMLGSTDFSTIPSFFVDKAALLHGSSSVNATGGALGGVVQLSTTPDNADSTKHKIQYTQGVGSFKTFDEFLRYSYSNAKWNLSTRLSFASSPNDYKYVNRDKKENIYDDNHNIIGQYYPTERNRSGAYKDFNAMQQVYYRLDNGDLVGIDAWYLNSNRELPMLTTDYGDDWAFDNRQREQTLRAVMKWSHYRRNWSAIASAGYVHTHLAYDYAREVAPGHMESMTRSRSRIHTGYLSADIAWYPSEKWMFTVNAAAHQHFVMSRDKNVILIDGNTAIVGYNKARFEFSGALSAKWQPIDPVGISIIGRQEVFGDKTAFIPAVLFDVMLYRPKNVLFKASFSRNHKFPSLNDLYFMPGGNPDLRDESGYTYDAGMSFNHAGSSPITYDTGLSFNWFDSYIDDWIIWLPTTKGFFSPRNVKKVHAYGIETRANIDLRFPHDVTLGLTGNYSWTPSINRGEPMSPADRSVGRQLPYVPLHSASVVGTVTWHKWGFTYKWSYYSRRFTMSNNDLTLSGTLPPYFMNNILLWRNFTFRPVSMQCKLAVNNLFNEHYLSVLAHPMPGINFEFFITITL